MVSEPRQQSMAWMETDYSKQTHFRWKVKWRLERLGALGIVGESPFKLWTYASPLRLHLRHARTHTHTHAHARTRTHTILIVNKSFFFPVLIKRSYLGLSWIVQCFGLYFAAHTKQHLRCVLSRLFHAHVLRAKRKPHCCNIAVSH